MYIEIIGLTFSAAGKLLIAFAALKVHFRMFKEHSIDEKVLKDIKKEWGVGIAGMSFILIGYILEVASVAFFS